MDVHIGIEIERKLKEKGISASWLAERVNLSTRALYNIFKKPEIKTGQLQEIGDALGFDFFGLYIQKDIPNLVNEDQVAYLGRSKSRVPVMVELDGSPSTLESWISVLKNLNRAIA